MRGLKAKWNEKETKKCDGGLIVARGLDHLIMPSDLPEGHSASR